MFHKSEQSEGQKVLQEPLLCSSSDNDKNSEHPEGIGQFEGGGSARKRKS